MQNEAKLVRIKIYILMLKEDQNKNGASDRRFPLLFDFLKA
ncbi:hypothetical protein HMPREF9378_1955 [Streptococcus sanguinis SK1 = NCTC 7863]|uniref:Uncharacterized protein n=1 Tax=Streptococcus sanguinis SK405 TaxID=888817 RepID=A0ABC9PB68_STRSA|nr:hypothetical protein HMPREF9390_1952 [Streptococcus sanguinis SK405]EGF05862.1 hypothetical protein HMPREF9378_1955 [Streptococcus sanguinis SK1 = NCTC 7863]EGF22498.1 hypothetical protein HMPREF9395_0234 [Streptococcus sanguinis SK1058]